MESDIQSPMNRKSIKDDNVDAPSPRFALLESVSGRFEQNRREREERINRMRNRQEAEKAHSLYLKLNVSSPYELQQARHVAESWAKRNGRQRPLMTERQRQVLQQIETVDRSNRRSQRLASPPSLNISNNANDYTETCPIIGCQVKFTNQQDHEMHERHFEHSPCNPLLQMPNGCLPDHPLGFVCPKCGESFQRKIECQEHMVMSDHLSLFSPLPVSAYMCPQCLLFFPEKMRCHNHMEELHHFEVAYPFNDDLNTNPSSCPKTVPVTQELACDFIQKVKARCPTFTLTCVECQVVVENQQELDQHRRETEEMHMFSSSASSNLAEIFAEYLGDSTCDTCLQVLHTPPSDGIHNCGTGMQGVSINLNCKSFNEFVLRCGHTLQMNPSGQTLSAEGSGVTHQLSLEPPPCPPEPSTSGLAGTSQGHVDIYSIASGSSPGDVESLHLDSASTTAGVDTHLSMSVSSTPGGADTGRLSSTSSEESASYVDNGRKRSYDNGRKRSYDNGRKRSHVIEISSSSEDEILKLTSSACKRRKINAKSSSSAKKSKKRKKLASRKRISSTSEKNECEVSVENDIMFCKDNNGNDKLKPNEQLACLSQAEHLQSSHQAALKEKLSADYIASLARKEHSSSKPSGASTKWPSPFTCNLPVRRPVKGQSSSSSTSSSSSEHPVKTDPVHLLTFREQGQDACPQSSTKQSTIGHALRSSTDASKSQAATVKRPNSVSPSRSFEAYPDNLEEMNLVLFVDLDNWGGFFKKLPRNLPEKSFVWGFYGGKQRWVPPNKNMIYKKLVKNNCLHIHEQCGTSKDAADFAICLTVGKMDERLPKHIPFTILSGDKGFLEVERQMKMSSRKMVVIDPHNAEQHDNEVLYAMIISLASN
ncbi:E3 SUMO-protein ligase ZNF451-like [Haliotis rubra]|uniref:E3 SUMO-protein ligase ZNF451-like n=1 Tax=Haliotis rubra TaxID=36100 RepID=UPI001EE62CE1|nr:E3 SUMO-protein ligase ZNF451-like [Haliotis rubra]